MATLDVFNNEAFQMTSLTGAINKLPYKPRVLGSLNMFEEVRANTEDVWVEERNGKLSLLPIAARGAINAVRQTPHRKARNFNVPHVPQHQTILASDIAGIRAFGTESELEAVAPYVNDQLAGMKDNHEVTHEYHRIGALKGNILDADGSTVIYNLFTEFGVTQEEIDFDYWVNDFGYVVGLIIRAIAGKLGGTPFGQIFAVCGDNYFDAVKMHTSTKDAYERWENGKFLRQSMLGSEWYALSANGFEFQDVMFFNYRGEIGGVEFVDNDEAYYFATGVPGLFQEIYAPANFMETVNTRALPYYAKQEPMKFNIGTELYTQSNMLAMCTRPSSIIKSTLSNFSGTGTTAT